MTERMSEIRLVPGELALLERVTEVVRTEVAPRAGQVDGGEFPEAGYQALARAGLAGLLIPPEHGGTGSSTMLYVAAMEEIAAACGSTSTVYMTQMHCAYPIEIAGSPEQKERFVPGLCSGELYGSLAITESEAGSDVAAMRTVAREAGGDYVIDGAKTFITTGDRADVIVLFAAVDPPGGRKGITAFLIEKGMGGFITGRVIEKMGMRGSSTAELFLDGCRVPATARLGGVGEGFELSMRSVVKSRLSAAAQGVGFARAAFEQALGWAALEGRLGTGATSPPFDDQAIAFELAGMRARVAASRELLWSVAALVDSSGRDRAAPDTIAEVSLAKTYCTDCGMEVADDAMVLAGSDASAARAGLERIWRDAKGTQIYDGTNQIQRLLVARDLQRAAIREKAERAARAETVAGRNLVGL